MGTAWIRSVVARRFDFSMSGDKSISPSRVFTDGVFTWFDFGDRWDSSDLPAVYRVMDGVDTPVNTRIKGSMLVAEASGAFTLRNGQITSVHPWAALFNRATGYEVPHMLLAAYMVTGLTVAGVYAAGILRGRLNRYHRPSKHYERTIESSEAFVK